MYAYCGNNPVMGYDPTGEVNWENIVKAGAVVLLMTTAVPVGVASGGIVFAALGLISQSTLLATTIGTAIGATTAGTLEIVSQCVQYGSDNIDYVDVAIETGRGALVGITTGFSSTIANTGLQVASKVTNILIGVSITIGYGINDDLSVQEVAGNTAGSFIGGSLIQGALFDYGVHRNNLGSGLGVSSILGLIGGQLAGNIFRNRGFIFDLFNN
jgi:hypothetical protein